MKKATAPFLLVTEFIFSGLFLLNFSVTCQEISKGSPSLPDNINKIVSASCMPCHSSKGGIMSRIKLNFTDWTQYSLEKQKSKAEKMYSVLKKGSMPPKSAREANPEIIPARDQVNTIKKWSESLKSDNDKIQIPF
jgi:hypothetical protein